MHRRHTQPGQLAQSGDSGPGEQAKGDRQPGQHGVGQPGEDTRLRRVGGSRFGVGLGLRVTVLVGLQVAVLVGLQVGLRVPVDVERQIGLDVGFVVMDHRNDLGDVVMRPAPLSHG